MSTWQHIPTVQQVVVGWVTLLVAIAVVFIVARRFGGSGGAVVPPAVSARRGRSRAGGTSGPSAPPT